MRVRPRIYLGTSSGIREMSDVYECFGPSAAFFFCSVCCVNILAGLRGFEKAKGFAH